MKPQDTPSTDKLSQAAEELSQLLTINHPDSKTAAYVAEYLSILRKNKAINDFAFLCKLHYFAMTVPNYVEEEHLSFTPAEMACWVTITQAFSDHSDPYGLPLLEVSVLKMLGLI